MDRCDLTDLLITSCACRKHRGGHTLDEETAVLRDELLADGWLRAKFAGSCASCGQPYPVGAAIRYMAGDSWESSWRAECCPDGA